MVTRHRGEHFITYGIVASLCIPETNMILYANYIVQLKKESNLEQVSSTV